MLTSIGRILPPILMGRWVVNIARGQPWHSNIAHAAPVDHELAVAVLRSWHRIRSVVSLFDFAAWSLNPQRNSCRHIRITDQHIPLVVDVSCDGIRFVWSPRPGGDTVVLEQPGEPRQLRNRHLAGRASGRIRIGTYERETITPKWPATSRSIGVALRGT